MLASRVPHTVASLPQMQPKLEPVQSLHQMHTHHHHHMHTQHHHHTQHQQQVFTHSAAAQQQFFTHSAAAPSQQESYGNFGGMHVSNMVGQPHTNTSSSLHGQAPLGALASAQSVSRTHWSRPSPSDLNGLLNSESKAMPWPMQDTTPRQDGSSSSAAQAHSSGNREGGMFSNGIDALPNGASAQYWQR